jgi:2-polyprenyl-6-hydroxyphenyl methylase/3-demethylubiquinone-9 3-methyltransferase
MHHTNFDPAELAKFQALADRWWDPDSAFWPLHQINPLRLNWIDSMVPLASRSVLDVGCGGGILSESMARRGANVLGIDLAEKPLKVAALHARDAGVSLNYRAISAEALAETAQASFDIVTCMEMLEHVPHPGRVVEACASMVKPGGWVFFSTINRTPLAWLVAIFGAERVLRMLPVGTHEYKKFIRPNELVAQAEAAGLQQVAQRGLGFNPLTRRFRLHGFQGVGYLLALRRPSTNRIGWSAPMPAGGACTGR